MNLTIFGEFADKPLYYEALYYLKKTGHIKNISATTYRLHHLIVQKLCYHFSSIRKTLNRLLNKEITHMNPSNKDILNSLFWPIKLILTRNIVITIPPYSILVYYLLLLKLLRKNITYYISWPYWEKGKTPKQTILFSDKLWHIFIKNTKTAAVTNAVYKVLENKKALTINIPHSVDTNIFSPLTHKPHKKLKVLFVGRIDKNKGIHYLLDAISKLDQSKFEFTLVGKGSLESEVISASKEYPIKYLGYIHNKKQLAKVYSSSDIFILPSYKTKSWEELFGIVLIEAMSSGLVCVTTDCVGQREIIDNNVNGMLIKQRDSRSIVNALNTLYSKPKLRINLGRNARETVMNYYDVKIVSRKWINILSK